MMKEKEIISRILEEMIGVKLEKWQQWLRKKRDQQLSSNICHMLDYVCHKREEIDQ